MMKNQWILCAALCAGLSSLDARPFTHATQDESSEDLEAVVLALQAEVEDLRKDIEDSRRVTRETVAYLRSVSKTAAEMSSTLDSAEEKGFTAGINPSSRETLLSGWRKQLNNLQKNVPTLGGTKEDTTNSRGVRRKR